ncbi:MAG: hypothetical protein ACUVXJ_18940, partial [Phycisphaerae bacterium]
WSRMGIRDQRSQMGIWDQRIRDQRTRDQRETTHAHRKDTTRHRRRRAARWQTEVEGAVSHQVVRPGGYYPLNWRE